MKDNLKQKFESATSIDYQRVNGKKLKKFKNRVLESFHVTALKKEIKDLKDIIRTTDWHGKIIVSIDEQVLQLKQENYKLRKSLRTYANSKQISEYEEQIAALKNELSVINVIKSETHCKRELEALRGSNKKLRELRSEDAEKYDQLRRENNRLLERIIKLQL
jgi:hypothetical protein